MTGHEKGDLLIQVTA